MTTAAGRCRLSSTHRAAAQRVRSLIGRAPRELTFEITHRGKERLHDIVASMSMPGATVSGQHFEELFERKVIRATFTVRNFTHAIVPHGVELVGNRRMP